MAKMNWNKPKQYQGRVNELEVKRMMKASQPPSKKQLKFIETLRKRNGITTRTVPRTFEEANLEIEALQTCDYATDKQIEYVKYLCKELNQTYTAPVTRKQASREIQRLKSLQDCQ